MKTTRTAKATTIDLISRKKNFARAAHSFFSNEQNKSFSRAAHFFCTFPCCCFARLKRETTFNFLFTRFMEKMLCVPVQSVFSLPHIFSPPLYNFHVWSPLLFFSRSSSLPVIQVNVDINILWNCCFLSLKVRAAM